MLGQHSEPDEGRGGVILAEIGAHPVDAAVVHQVGFLEAALAGDDVVGGHDDVAAAVGERLRVRRSLLVGQDRRPAEQGEAEDGRDQQHPFEDVADGVDRSCGKIPVLHACLPVFGQVSGRSAHTKAAIAATAIPKQRMRNGRSRTRTVRRPRSMRPVAVWIPL